MNFYQIGMIEVCKAQCLFLELCLLLIETLLVSRVGYNHLIASTIIDCLTTSTDEQFFYSNLANRAGVCFLLDEPDLGEQNDEEYRKFKEEHNFDKMKKETKVKYKLKDMEDDFK